MSDPGPITIARDLFLSLKPGKEIEVQLMILNEQALNFVLDGIGGSAYKLGYINPFTTRNEHWVLFRLSEEEQISNEQSGERSYVSPDRRHLFNRVGEKRWTIK